MQSGHLPKDKEFLFIVDFTWNNGHFCMLELGEYFRSSLAGLDEVRKAGGKCELDEEIKVARKKRYPDAVYFEGETSSWFSMVTIEDLTSGLFSKYNTKQMHTVKQLLYARMTQALQQPLRSLVVTLGTKLGFSLAEFIALESALEKKTDCCMLDFPTGGLYFSCIDKVVFSLLNQESSAVPATRLIDLSNFDHQHAQHFIQQCSETHFVIKPVSKSCAMGVKVLSKEEILPFLTRLHNNRRTHSTRFTTIYDNYWHYEKDQFLLLQSCCPSQKNQDGYRPTGRAVIRATLSAGGELLPLEYLGAYWELPKTNSEILCTESVVLAESWECNTPCVTSIDQHDWCAITKAMDAQLSPLIKKMFHTSTKTLLQLFAQDADPVMQLYGAKEFSSAIPANKPDEVLCAGLACYEVLTYGTPHSEENRAHLVAAVMGLLSTPAQFNYSSLQQAFKLQYDLVSVSNACTLFTPKTLGVTKVETSQPHLAHDITHNY